MEVLVEILLNILDPKSAMTCNLQHSICVKGLWSNPADNYCLAFPKKMFHVPYGLSLGRLSFPCNVYDVNV